MERIKVEGIVIKNIDFQESSKILTILTRELGSISCISKGCKSMKSKLRSISNKFSYGEYYINYKENGLSTLTSGDTLDPFLNIMNDISKISYATYIVDLTSQVLKEASDENVFDIMITAIKKINSGIDERVITMIVETKYLEYLGVLPNMNECTICGNKDNIATISVKNGGYVCQNCYESDKIYNMRVIKLLRLFYLVDLKKLDKVKIEEENIKDIEEFLDLYYSDYTGLYLNSKKFLNSLNKVGK